MIQSSMYQLSVGAIYMSLKKNEILLCIAFTIAPIAIFLALLNMYRSTKSVCCNCGQLRLQKSMRGYTYEDKTEPLESTQRIATLSSARCIHNWKTCYSATSTITGKLTCCSVGYGNRLLVLIARLSTDLELERVSESEASAIMGEIRNANPTNLEKIQSELEQKEMSAK